MDDQDTLFQRAELSTTTRSSLRLTKHTPHNSSRGSSRRGSWLSEQLPITFITSMERAMEERFRQLEEAEQEVMGCASTRPQAAAPKGKSAGDPVERVVEAFLRECGCTPEDVTAEFVAPASLDCCAVCRAGATQRDPERWASALQVTGQMRADEALEFMRGHGLAGNLVPADLAVHREHYDPDLKMEEMVRRLTHCEFQKYQLLQRYQFVTFTHVDSGTTLTVPNAQTLALTSVPLQNMVKLIKLHDELTRSRKK